MARADKFSGGSYPAGFVLAEALAHASTDELLQLVADNDEWRRKVLQIDPSLVCHSNLVCHSAHLSASSEKCLEGATSTKMDGQFSGGHVKLAPKTTKAEVEK